MRVRDPVRGWRGARPWRDARGRTKADPGRGSAEAWPRTDEKDEARQAASEAVAAVRARAPNLAVADRRPSRLLRRRRSRPDGFRARGPTQAAAHDNGADPVKTISVRDLQKNIKDVVDSAQSDRVVVTRRGAPAAVLLGVEGKDWETVILKPAPRSGISSRRGKEPAPRSGISSRRAERNRREGNLGGGARASGGLVRRLPPNHGGKPRVLPDAPTTAPSGPYDDTFGPNDLRRYRYRGTDPDHPDNRRLRVGGRGWIPGLCCPTDFLGVRAVRQRDPQAALDAYRRQCAFCRLRHAELLDAAIVPDAEEGEPTVANGLGSSTMPLSTDTSSAFDPTTSCRFARTS